MIHFLLGQFGPIFRDYVSFLEGILSGEFFIAEPGSIPTFERGLPAIIRGAQNHQISSRCRPTINDSGLRYTNADRRNFHPSAVTKWQNHGKLVLVYTSTFLLQLAVLFRSYHTRTLAESDCLRGSCVTIMSASSAAASGRRYNPASTS